MKKIFGGLLVGLLCVDMGSKQYIEETFQAGEERDTCFPKVVLRKVYNRGFLLHTLDKYPALIKGVSAGMAAGIAIYDIWLFLQKGRLLRKFGMVFLSAGAASNTWDRLVRGKVTDYIGFRSRNKFLGKITANLADFYVALGGLLAVLGGR